MSENRKGEDKAVVSVGGGGEAGGSGVRTELVSRATDRRQQDQS